MAGKIDQADVQSKKDKHESLADFIKNVHSTLRKNVCKAHGDFQSVWKQHCKDETILKQYAGAMRQLAVEHWCGNNLQRIEWCQQVCMQYFYEGGQEKCISKDSRHILMNLEQHSNCNCVNKAEECYRSFATKLDKLILLDVGSCFNPFTAFPDIFLPIGIDLCPGDETVFKCDFLDLKVVSCHKDSPTIATVESFPGLLQSFIIDDRQIRQLPGECFNVVVFCLLLTYFPAKEQRFDCCKKAHDLLNDGGLLLIITPDSSHQNKNMNMIKSWRTAIESLGFSRWKYHKAEHTHCMAFRKRSLCKNLVQQYDEVTLSEMLYIHQDLQDSKDRDHENERSCTKTENYEYNFSELPFPSTDL